MNNPYDHISKKSRLILLLLRMLEVLNKTFISQSKFMIILLNQSSRIDLNLTGHMANS